MDDSDPFGPYGLCAIELAHKPVYDNLFSRTRPQLSDYTFANTYIWRDCIHIHWRMLHDSLCVFANGEEGLSLLFPPLGGDFVAALAEAMAICRGFNADAGIAATPRVEYINESLLELMPPGSMIRPMSGDYVYATRSMIDLSGSDLGSKRSARNHFARNHAPRSEVLEPRHVGLCLEMLRRWEVQVEDSSDNSQRSVCLRRAKEIVATECALRNFEALQLRGMVLWAGEHLAGFTLGEELGGGEACSILIEKTDRSFRGSANYIFWDFCRSAWAHTTWCNVGDDWEVPSLAWTKQSYRPAHRLAKWAAWPMVRTAVRVVVPSAGSATAADIARPHDLDALVRLEARCFDGHDAFTQRQIRYLLHCPRATTYVVRRGGRIVASATVLRRRTRDGVSARLYSLAVDPDFRRRGLGRRMLRRCLSGLGREGVGAVNLEVREGNLPALALYESAGFRRVRLLRDYYGADRHAWKLRRAASPVRKAVRPVATSAGLA